MIQHIPFYSSLIGEGTTNEILLYGLIEVLSTRDGFCFASSDYFAEVLGLAKGTISNLLSSIHKKGWVHIELENNNRRVAIQPLLGIKCEPKKVKKEASKSTKKAQNSLWKTKGSASRQNEAPFTLELSPLHARMKASTGVVTGVGYNNINNNIIKENNKRKDDSLPAGNGPASRLYMKREDFESDDDYEAEFYKRNTICLSATH